jgi:hypothetical protein
MKDIKYINGNPYDYNRISLKNHPATRDGVIAKKKDTRTPNRSETDLDPEFKLIVQFLGLEGAPDLSKYQDKLRDIMLWGIERTQSHDTPTIIDALREKINACPSMCERRIDDLWAAIKIEQQRQDKVDYNGHKLEREEVKI